MDEVGEAEAHAAAQRGPQAEALDEDRRHAEPDGREPGEPREDERGHEERERQEDGGAEGEREHEATRLPRNVEHERARGDVGRR